MSRKLYDVAAAQLFAALGADLAVDEDIALLNDGLGLPAAADEIGEFQRGVEFYELSGDFQFFHYLSALSLTGRIM